ncbi:XdhC family protein, partial [Lactococcus lactis]
MQLEGNDWPTFGWISDIRPCLESARRQHRNVVLGTITRLVGSSPRPAGTQMVFDQDR